jgi:outer membrane protein OmpA-like peptidoglycan-associated protein
LLKRVESAADQFGGVHVEGQNVDFGDRARFDFGSYNLTAPQATLLRSFVPKVLAIARDPLGRKWFKQIIVEGFTDQKGTYLYNLNLSLERSQRVLCALFAQPLPDEHPLTDDEKGQIRKLFLVGGYSFNSAKEKPEESRRIELKLDFLGMGEHVQSREGTPSSDFGSCAI